MTDAGDAAYAALDEDVLTKSHAFVVLRESAVRDGIGEVLTAFARVRLEAYKRPRWVMVAADLPRTASGKVQRFRLGELTRALPRHNRARKRTGSGDPRGLQIRRRRGLVPGRVGSTPTRFRQCAAS